MSLSQKIDPFSYWTLTLTNPPSLSNPHRTLSARSKWRKISSCLIYRSQLIIRKGLIQSTSSITGMSQNLLRTNYLSLFKGLSNAQTNKPFKPSPKKKITSHPMPLQLKKSKQSSRVIPWRRKFKIYKAKSATAIKNWKNWKQKITRISKRLLTS